MKSAIFLFSAWFTINSYSQTINQPIFNLKQQQNIHPIAFSRDTTLQVFHIESSYEDNLPEYFINGIFAGKMLPPNLDPAMIVNMNVIKKDTMIRGEQQKSGQIFITTKPNYNFNPMPLSLNNLKGKYCNIKDGASMFYIDDQLINADYNSYYVDQNSLLRIYVEKYENKNENLNINLIRILTKTRVNLEKVKHPEDNIRIR